MALDDRNKRTSIMTAGTVFPAMVPIPWDGNSEADRRQFLHLYRFGGGVDWDDPLDDGAFIVDRTGVHYAGVFSVV